MEPYNSSPMGRKATVTHPSSPETKAIGTRIAKVRRSKGFSQTELGQRLGIIQKTISDYERGRLRLPAELLPKLAHALDVSPEHLLTGQDAPSEGRAPSRRILRRLQKIERLPPRQQTTVLKTLDMLLKASGN